MLRNNDPEVQSLASSKPLQPTRSSSFSSPVKKLLAVLYPTSYIYFPRIKEPSDAFETSTMRYLVWTNSIELTKINEKPQLLNQFPNSTAVLKETFRLFPLGASLRAGKPGYFIKDLQERTLPTDGFLVWAVSQPLHRDPSFWPQPNVFLPERFLVGPEDPLYPIKGAWRPFEFGPKNCIGQELAILEMKIAMVLVLQRFDVVDSYEQVDREKPGRIKRLHGERTYQVELGGPSDGLPCKIKHKR